MVEVERPLLELGWNAASAVAPAARVPAKLGGVSGRPVGVADRPPLQRGRQCPAGAELPVVARHELNENGNKCQIYELLLHGSRACEKYAAT